MPHTAMLTFLPRAFSSGWRYRWRRSTFPPDFHRQLTITWRGASTSMNTSSAIPPRRSMSAYQEIPCGALAFSTAIC